jgi:hypothetical protein
MQPMGIDQDLINSEPFQVLKPYLKQGRTINRQQAFWCCISQWPQSFTTSCNEKEGFLHWH